MRSVAIVEIELNPYQGLKLAISFRLSALPVSNVEIELNPYQGLKRKSAIT
jgi:hypothetical protein